MWKSKIFSLYMLLIVVLVGLDQWIKWIVETNMQLDERIPVIGEFLQWHYVLNTGAAFSMLDGQRWFLIVVPTLMIIFISYLFVMNYRQQRFGMVFALSVLLAGAIGNLIDRIFNDGAVIDYIRFHFDFNMINIDYTYTFAIFNLADIAVNVGIIGVLIAELSTFRKRK
jgi:signal peptidase II